MLLLSNLEKEFLEWKTYLIIFPKVDLSYKLQQQQQKTPQEIIREAKK